MEKYNIIYSLGTDCACATYMKQAKLRSFSSPFDWLTHADFKTRMTLLLNDFEGFLNFEDLVFLEKNPNVFNDNHCDYYHNIKTDFYFYHDFEAGKTLEETFPAVKEKYNRRINRFYETIQNNEKILLIWFAHDWQTPDEDVLDLCKKVCEKFSKQIDFLIIEHDENMEKGEIKKQELSKNIRRYHLYTRSWDEKGNPTTQGRTKDCLPIFQKYKQILPLHIKLKKIILKFIIMLIPIKRIRKKLRAKYL